MSYFTKMWLMNAKFMDVLRSSNVKNFDHQNKLWSNGDHDK